MTDDQDGADDARADDRPAREAAAPDHSFDGNVERDISTRDEGALTDLFAALVSDPPASEVSPLHVIKLAKAEARLEQGGRTRRLKIIRNVGLAAAIAALVVLVGPKVIGHDSGLEAASSSPNAAAAAGEATAGAGTAESGAPVAAGTAAAGSVQMPFGAQAAGSQAASSAAASGAPAAASSAFASAPAPAATAGSAPAASSAGSGSASGGATPSSSSVCLPLSPTISTAVRQALVANSLTLAGCTTKIGSRPTDTGAGGSVLVNVQKAAAAACLKGEPRRCHAVDRTSDAYRTTTGTLAVWVYGNGYEVYLQTATKDPVFVTLDQLVASGRAVVKALG